MSSTPTPVENELKTRKSILPAWLVLSLLSILFWGIWGAMSKVVSDQIDPYTNQALFTLGLIPAMALVFRFGELSGGSNRKRGMFYALLTGLLGGAGNIAFFKALGLGGKASVIVPVTSMSPLLTVIMAYFMLRERMSGSQKVGLGFALAAIYLLSL